MVNESCRNLSQHDVVFSITRTGDRKRRTSINNKSFGKGSRRVDSLEADARPAPLLVVDSKRPGCL